MADIVASYRCSIGPHGGFQPPFREAAEHTSGGGGVKGKGSDSEGLISKLSNCQIQDASDAPKEPPVSCTYFRCIAVYCAICGHLRLLQGDFFVVSRRHFSTVGDMESLQEAVSQHRPMRVSGRAVPPRRLRNGKWKMESMAKRVRTGKMASVGRTGSEAVGFGVRWLRCASFASLRRIAPCCGKLRILHLVAGGFFGATAETGHPDGWALLSFQRTGQDGKTVRPRLPSGNYCLFEQPFR